MKGTSLTVHCDASVKYAHACIGFVAFDRVTGAEVDRRVESFSPPDVHAAERAAIELARRHFAGRQGIRYCTDCQAAAVATGVRKIKSSNNRAHDAVHSAVSRAYADQSPQGRRR